MFKYKVIPRKNPQNQEVKYYAQLETPAIVKLTQLTDAISKESTVTKHDVKAVLSALEDHIVIQLHNGASVHLGDLGSFRASLSSEGVVAAEEFTSANIKRVKVIFTPSSAIKYLLDKSNPNVQFVRVDGEEAEKE